MTFAKSLFLFVLAFNAFATGHETENGGSVVVDGQSYELSDLHFVALPHEGYQLDSELKALLKKLDQFVNDARGSRVRTFAPENFDFFSKHVFSNLVEFRLVGSLPSGCTSISVENLDPSLPVAQVGCTKGWITYIVPKVFSKLDAIGKALFVVHERMHGYAPSQPYEVKTDIIKAYNVVLRKFFGKDEELNEKHFLLKDEVKYINLLRKRTLQLSSIDPEYYPPEDPFLSYEDQWKGISDFFYRYSYEVMNTGGLVFSEISKKLGSDPYPQLQTADIDPSVRLAPGSWLSHGKNADLRGFKDSILIGMSGISKIGGLMGRDNELVRSRIYLRSHKLDMNHVRLKDNAIYFFLPEPSNVTIGLEAGEEIIAEEGKKYCIQQKPGMFTNDPIVIRTKEELDQFIMVNDSVFCRP